MLSATRVAAFEFLIQFRSAGRGQIRRGINDFRRIANASRQNAASYNLSTIATNRYATALARANNTARSAAATEAALAGAVTAGARARVRAARISRVARGRLSQSNLSGAFASRGVQFIGRNFGNNAAGAAARGVAGLRTSFSRLNPVIASAAGLFRLFSGVVRSSIGIFFSWVKANAIVVASVGLLAGGIARLSDSYVQLTNRIRVASDGSETIANTTGRLLQIALDSRSAFSTVAELYGRVSINAKELGVSQEDVLRLTRLTTQAFRIAGGTAREESQTVVQFAQALGSNRLSGDELRAVREQAPELSQALARGLTALGRFGQVNVGTLKNLGEDGSLTTSVVTEALLTQERDISIRFGRIQATFADGIQNIRSSLFVLGGAIAESTKLGPSFFRFGDRLARSFQRISSSSGEIGLAFSNLGEFFRILFGNANGLTNLFGGLSDIGDFFNTLPDRILDAARNLNQFIALVNNGQSARSAALATFGIDISDLRRTFEPINNVIDAFVQQFRGLLTSLSTIAGTMASIARFLDRLPFLSSGDINQSSDTPPPTELFTRRTTGSSVLPF